MNGNPEAYELEWVEAGMSPTSQPDTSLEAFHKKFTLKGVESGKSIWFFIRAKCGPNDYSNWNGPYQITTALTNPSRCGMNLELDQENCDTPQEIPIEINGFAGSVLGTTHYVSGVSMIIEHGWPEDLQISLRAPNGKEAMLVQNKGRITDHFGNPNDPMCQEVTFLDPFSCHSLENSSPPFIGTFKPDGDLLDFLDGGSVNGTWKLIVCDDLPTDIGFLKYLNIHFRQIECLPVQTHAVTSISDTSVILNWEPILAPCDSVEIEFGPSGFTPGSGTKVRVPCFASSHHLPGLSPSQTYEAFISQVCNDTLSAKTCPISWTTACASISIMDDFNDQDICEDDCGSICDLTGNWFNTADDAMDWLVKNGPTQTSRTGPEADASGNGNYIYIETSDSPCQNGKEAILESTCMLIQGDVALCQFSFQYHMYGRDMGSLSLEISEDDGANWNVIWEKQGDQGDNWNQVFIDLQAYAERVCKLRFVGKGGLGQRGDIALDDLIFYGSIVAPSNLTSFYKDQDGDSYGSNVDSIFYCGSTPPTGYVADKGDCDDDNADINPGAVEVPCNLIDENCNGMSDDALSSSLKLEMATIVEASCRGASDGSIAVEVSGGIPPYSYTWSNSQPDSAFVDSLKAGFYKVTISDQSGCLIESDYLEIKEKSVLSYAVTRLEKAQCIGIDDGLIELQVAGGLAPYHYNWSNGDTTQVIDSLGVGQYSVTITDSNGCTLSSNDIQVLAFSNFQVSVIELNNPSCYGNDDGSIRLKTNGGSGPYLFEWSNGQTGASLSGLSAGAYSYTVTDANGCSIRNKSVSLTDPDSMELLLTGLDHPACPGGNDGAIKIQVKGGTQPYYYNWSNGSFRQDQFNLKSGFYTVTVTDVNGCSMRSHPIEVSEPQDVSFYLDSLKHVNCPLSADGELHVSASGGTPPYQYYWSDGTLGSSSLSELNPGSYRVTLTDDLQCKYVSQDFVINLLNTPLHANISLLDSIKCNGDKTATLEVELLDGLAPFRYNWSTGVEIPRLENKDTLKNLSAGSYRVTITDDMGCIAVSEPYRILQPLQLDFQLISLMDPVCNGSDDGCIEVDILGGTAPYRLQWSNGARAPKNPGLSPGIYNFSVTDKNDCSFESPDFSISEPEKLGLIADIIGSTTTNPTGEISLTTFGGKQPHTIIWDADITRTVGTRALDLLPGDYTVQLLDSVQCTLDTLLTVPVISTTFSGGISIDQFDLFPNPAGSFITIEISDVNPLCGRIELMNQAGLLITELAQLDCTYRYGNVFQIDHYPAGIYYLQLRMDQGTVTKKFVISP